MTIYSIDNPLSDDGRNKINKNFENTDKKINDQKTRVDDLIKNTPQPSEVVDARGGAPVLRDRLDKVDAELAQNANQITSISADVDDYKVLRRKNNIIPRHVKTYSMLRQNVPLSAFIAGDSIAQGSGATSGNSWSAKLGASLKNALGLSSDWTVKNVAVGGRTITNVVNQISFDLEKNDRAYVTKKSYPYNYPIWIIMTGRNDFAVLSKKDFEYYYRLVIRMAKSYGIDVVLCSEPARVNTSTGDIVDGVGGNNYPEYVEIIKYLAESEGCSFLDIYQEWVDMKNSDGVDLTTLTSDGVHPNDSGHSIICDMMTELITSIPKELSNVKPNIQYPYNLVPQILIDGATTGTYTQESIVTQAETSYKSRTGNNYAYKVLAGNDIYFPIHQIKADYIFVNVIITATTGKITVQCPTGYTLTEINPETGLTVEKTYILKTNDVTIGKGGIYLYVSGGDAYITGVGVIQPTCNVWHNGINGTKTGTWSPVTYESTRDFFIESNTAGNTIEIEWYGVELLINYARSNSFGKFSISTDGGGAAIVDCYQNLTYVFGGVYVSTGRFNFGKHKTVITVLNEKNTSSSGYKVGIGRGYIFDVMHNDGKIIANVGDKIKVNINNNANYIRATAPYTLTNGVLESTVTGMIETDVI